MKAGRRVETLAVAWVDQMAGMWVDSLVEKMVVKKVVKKVEKMADLKAAM